MCIRGRDGEDDNSAVGAAGDDGVGPTRELELTYERSVALEECQARSVGYVSLARHWQRWAYPVLADQIRTVVSNPPEAIRSPSNATV